MKILSYNPGHDGAAALLEGDQLIYSIEAEKDDGPRHDRLSTSLFLRSMSLSEIPDALAISGWTNFTTADLSTDALFQPRNLIEAGYFDEGYEGRTYSETLFAGRNVKKFSSSHVRSHIMCSYGLSSFPQGQPCYVLVWEGEIGAFYYVDSDVCIRKVGHVMRAPGIKYAFLHALANAKLEGDPAGKVMALAAYGQRRQATSEERELINEIMCLSSAELWHVLLSLDRSKFNRAKYYKTSVEAQEFKDFAWQFSSALFDKFYQFAREHISPGLPLLIAGGCGLNCDWNTSWRDCGLFSDVFVPPCPNDSGVAIGAAIDALHYYTGKAKIDWNVYAGDSFVEDEQTSAHFSCSPLDLSDVCHFLLDGAVIAWIQGRYEIGPRALGNRSLLAAPFSAETRDRLNHIKQREPFRPVAPICLEEDFSLHFDTRFPSPYMLYFQRVRSESLSAITHVDGSARAQSVNDSQNPEICALLREFRRQSGVAVLCNTSLNFSGRGFINHLSQLFEFGQTRGIDGLVVGNRFWRRHRNEVADISFAINPITKQR